MGTKTINSPAIDEEFLKTPTHLPTSDYEQQQNNVNKYQFPNKQAQKIGLFSYFCIFSMKIT